MEGILHKIWAVNANWNADNRKWNVNANSVTNPNDWNAGNQVGSRNSFRSKTLLWGLCLFLPASEHFSYLAKFFGQSYVFFDINRSNFPRDLENKF